MLRPFITSLIFLCCYTIQGFCNDTIPPTGEITGPIQGSVISANVVRISVKATDDESGVQSVQFYTLYKDANRSYPATHELIGTDSVAPYEIVWDCSGIHDQAIFSFGFYCDIIDNAGNKTRTKRVSVCLDRNAELSKKEFFAKRINDKINIDGVLEKEWLKLQPLELWNEDNKYKIYACWNDEFFYISADVTDNHVYTSFQKSDQEKSVWDTIMYNESLDVHNCVWRDDCIGFFFDINANHTPVPEPEDKMLEVSPTGVVLSFMLNVHEAKFYNWKGIICGSQIVQDVNNDTIGYVVELAIPWESLDVDPTEKNKMGFEVYMVDKEHANGERVISTWSGLPQNHFNPSEWGKIILRKKQQESSTNIILLTITIIIAIGIVILLFLKYKRGKTKDMQEIYISRPELLVKNAKEYIQENYSDNQLSREKIADQLNINSVYLSDIFRKHTNKTFPHYINELRIVHSKDLLLKTDKSITEIAEEVGYGTLEYFIKVFKRFEKCTPNAFRKNNSNSV